MNKEVLVYVKGLQFAGDEVSEANTDEEIDKIETICPGEYFYRNDTHFVLYEEIAEGFEEPVKNMIKLKDKEFVLTKKGPFNVQMMFSEGRKSMTDYITPFGNIMVAMDTHKIEVSETQDSMEIHIEYALEANYQFVADCDITVTIKNKK